MATRPLVRRYRPPGAAHLHPGQARSARWPCPPAAVPGTDSTQNGVAAVDAGWRASL